MTFSFNTFLSIFYHQKPALLVTSLNLLGHSYSYIHVLDEFGTNVWFPLCTEFYHFKIIATGQSGLGQDGREHCRALVML